MHTFCIAYRMRRLVTCWDPSGSFQDLSLLSKQDEELCAFVPFSIVSVRENKHLFDIAISFSFVFSLKGILTFREIRCRFFHGYSHL